MIESPEQFISNLSEWQGASFSKLSGGLNNHVWKVTKGKKSAILKIDYSPRQTPFISRFEEKEIQSFAYKNKLAPKVIFAKKGVYFTEYVGGSVGSKEILKKDNNLEAIAISLRKLHALPFVGRKFNAKLAAKKYYNTPGVVKSNIEKKCLKIIDETPLSSNLCLCHNDLVANNFIFTPKALLIDWEYSSVNDPFFDLATVIEHHELTAKETKLFLDAYTLKKNQCWKSNLERQRRLYLAIFYLWMTHRHDINHSEKENIATRITTIDL